MDIRKLQRAIVDGLEDVKGQDIVVFNTEHLSPMFERVVVASGTSNRQTKSLASSVRNAVREAGGQVLSVEGGENGEWIIVDCGAAVVHVMQPAIRQYYHLEEIWGGKQVKMKLASDIRGLVKASEEEDEPAPAKRTGARRPAASQSPIEEPSPKKKAAAKTVLAKKASAPNAAARKVSAKPPARKAAAKKPAAKKAAIRTIVVNAPVPRKTPARKAAGAASEAKAPPRKRAPSTGKPRS
jgi:ribosome-associated protein